MIVLVLLLLLVPLAALAQDAAAEAPSWLASLPVFISPEVERLMAYSGAGLAALAGLLIFVGNVGQVIASNVEAAGGSPPRWLVVAYRVCLQLGPALRDAARELRPGATANRSQTPAP